MYTEWETQNTESKKRTLTTKLALFRHCVIDTSFKPQIQVTAAWHGAADCYHMCICVTLQDSKLSTWCAGELAYKQRQQLCSFPRHAHIFSHGSNSWALLYANYPSQHYTSLTLQL